MRKELYYAALEQELRRLTPRVTRVKAQLERTDGEEKFWLAQDLRALEKRQQTLAQRLLDLDGEGDGLWEDVRVEVRWIGHELANGIAKWFDHLDAKCAGRQTWDQRG